jgi:hypothetical protein
MAKKAQRTGETSGKGPSEQSRIDAVRDRRLARERPENLVKQEIATLLRSPGITLEDMTASMNHWSTERRAWTPWTEHQVALELSHHFGDRLPAGLSLQVRRTLRPPRPASLVAARPSKAERRRRNRELREQQERKRVRAEAAAKAREFDEAARAAERFFAAAGIAARIERQRATIGSVAVGITPARFLQPRGYQDWLDQIVDDHFRHRLLDSAVSHLTGLAGMKVVPTEHGIAVLAFAGGHLATVQATRVSVRHYAPIRGNFLTDGAPWDEVRHWLTAAPKRRAAAERRAGQAGQRARPAKEALVAPRAAVWLRPDVLGTLAAELAAAAYAASEQLRTARNLAFAHPVELAFDSQTIRFEPITVDGAAIRLPFRWTAGHGDVDGQVTLSASRDPLPCALIGSTADGVAALAWATTLIAYASLTCRERLVSTSVEPGQRQAPPAPAREPRTRQLAAPRSSSFSELALEPDYHTRRLLSSYVAGHRRRLPPAKRASERARVRARRVRITLCPDETWVTPHVRGAPAEAVLRFAWTPPAVIGTRHS